MNSTRRFPFLRRTFLSTKTLPRTGRTGGGSASRRATPTGRASGFVSGRCATGRGYRSRSGALGAGTGSASSRSRHRHPSGQPSGLSRKETGATTRARTRGATKPATEPLRFG